MTNFERITKSPEVLAKEIAREIIEKRKQESVRMERENHEEKQ